MLFSGQEVSFKSRKYRPLSELTYLSCRHFSKCHFDQHDVDTSTQPHATLISIQSSASPVSLGRIHLSVLGHKTDKAATMQSSSLITSSVLLLLSVLFITASAFAPHTSCASSRRLLQHHNSALTPLTQQKARGFGDDFDGIDDDDDEDDDRELVYARRSGRRGREEGAYYDADTTSSGSRKYQDNVEFFDLDDDDEIFDDDFDRNSDDLYAETYNGIIPNPLLDAMDPDGVYERLGPELFKDWTFWRDMILFAAFLTLFTRDTHHYGTFDSIVEGMERLPANFIRQ